MASNATEPTTSSDTSFPVREIRQGFLGWSIRAKLSASCETRDSRQPASGAERKEPTCRSALGVKRSVATNAGIGVVDDSDTNRHEMYFPMMALRHFFVAAGTSLGSVISA